MRVITLCTAILVVVFFTAPYATLAQTPIRICTYNSLKWSLANEDGRTPHFKRILDSIRPTILLCQEVEEGSLGPHFIANVLTFGTYGASPFIDGEDTDNMCLYDQTKVNFLGQRRIGTSLRDIAEFTLEIIPEVGRMPDTIVIYSVHLKASDGSENVADRTNEIARLLQNITPNPSAIVCGDFNVYSPQEAAYTQLVGTQAVKKFIDPLGTNWARNSASHLSKYTQSTRTEQTFCGGGVNGGIDDRFDLILVTELLANSLVPNSYTVFGNDGTNRLNSSIDNPPNQKVSAEMAAALKCASDHLPSFVDIIVGRRVASLKDERLLPKLRVIQNTLRSTNIQPNTRYTITDVTGKEWLTTSSESTTLDVNIQALPHGAYTFGNGKHSAVFIR